MVKCHKFNELGEGRRPMKKQWSKNMIDGVTERMDSKTYTGLRGRVKLKSDPLIERISLR